MPKKYSATTQDKALTRVQIGNFIEGKSSNPKKSWKDYKEHFKTLSNGKEPNENLSSEWESSDEDAEKIYGKKRPSNAMELIPAKKVSFLKEYASTNS